MAEGRSGRMRRDAEATETGAAVGAVGGAGSRQGHPGGTIVRAAGNVPSFHGGRFSRGEEPGQGERSPALEAAFDHMKKGNLVPDETVLAMVHERINCLRCVGGFVLDGFPRTVAQAEALEKVLRLERLDIGAVLNYELPIEEIVTRLSGRRTCTGCKSVFHTLWRPSRVPEVCDHCGGKLDSTRG